ncbi:MAG: hypothetical protein SOW51_01290 [Oscillospiraceae bacterium]|nr:hypothetical protein [Oscillospiraceae bacterium]
MKLTKKVLSILLAIAMVLGTFAVAASANGNPDTAPYKSRIWLTASPITAGAEWTSKTEWTAPTWTDTKTGDMEVTAGQKIMIAVHINTNFDVGHCSSFIYYDDRLLDPNEIRMAQGYAKSTLGNMRTMTSYNESDPYLTNTNFNKRASSCSSLYTNNNFLNAMNRCADDDGNVYFKKLVGETGKYANITEAKAAGWGFYMYDTYPDPEIATTTSLDGTEYLLAIPMQIPEDAQPGDTYKFVMPEDNIRRATNKVSGTYIGRCPDGDGSSQIVNSLDYIYLDGERYFDLRGTEITLTVKGAEAQVDYSRLQAKYDEVKDTVVANYNNTEDFVKALAAAKTILDEKTADQPTTDAALTALEAGYAKLQIKSANYTALNAAKDAAANIKAENYEQDANWTAFQNAYRAAQNIAAGLDITHQTEISAAATALTNAIANLTPKVVEEDADYTVLNAEITASQNIVDTEQASWYTEATWSAFTTALAEAKAVPTGLKKSSQGTIDAAASALNAARTGLVEAEANYTNLDALIRECDALTAGDYTSVSWQNLTIALNAAKAVARDIKARNQATIDTAYNNLKAAKDALVPLGKANYQPLIDEINKGTAYTEDYYTTESWAAYQTVLAAAQAMVDAGNLKEDEQAQISKMVEDLIAAKAALIFVDADYTAVDAALAKIPADADLAAYYTNDTATAVIAARNAVVRGYNKTRQPDVDKMAADIETAVANLRLIPADTTALKAAIDEAKSVNSALYTADSYNAMKAELDKAEALYAKTDLTKKDNQAKVDAQTKALNDAITALVPAGADYTKLNNAIKAFEALTESDWTADTWAVAKAKYDAAVEASEKVYTVDKQAELDAIADELTDAISKLVPAPADFTALDAILKDINVYLTSWAKYLTDDYKTRANAAVESANAADFRALTKNDQATVDAKTAEITELYNNPEFLDWDYTKINEAKTAFEAIDRTRYTDESIAAVVALFAEVGDDWKQDPRKPEGAQQSKYASQMLIQSRVLKWETLLVEKPVEEKADYTALDAAIKTAEELIAKGTSIYTDDSVKVLRDALAEGKALSRELLASEQGTVDAATAKINAAMPLTEKDASYTALDAAIALAKTKNADDYTEASFKAMTDKLAAAEAVARNLKITAQATIDKATNDLNAAISALVPKPTEVKGAIQLVEWTPSTDSFNTFSVKVNHVDGDYAYKIQFIDADGNTRTITRRNKAGIVTAATVKTYDAQGNECSELSADAAYDIWTINTRIATGCEIKVIAKFGYTWESKDVAYKFTVDLVEPTLDTAVYAITPAATAGKVGRVGVQVETGMDIQGVRTVMSTGATLTQKAYTVENGHKVFDAQASCYLEGENVIKVQVKYGNEWHDADSFTYTATK